MQSSNFGLEVIRHGSSSKQFYHEGKYYVEGKQGDEFSVKIKNNTSRRVLAVLTVDGLSAMDGKTGSFNSTGYILDGWDSITVPGWRISNKEVAHFEFVRGDKSYASSKGKGIHNGVIGCAFFYEKQYWPKVTISNLPDAFPQRDHGFWKKNWDWTGEPDWLNKYRLADNNVNTSFSAQKLGKSMDMSVVNSVAADYKFSSSGQPSQIMNSWLGTAFGDRTEHKVVAVEFEKETSSPIEVLTVYYDTRQGLKSRGIDVEGYTEIASPFPGSQSEYNKFCEPPKDWND